MNYNTVATTVKTNLQAHLVGLGYPELVGVRGLDYQPRNYQQILDSLPCFVVSFNYPEQSNRFLDFDQIQIQQAYLYIDFYYPMDTDLTGEDASIGLNRLMNASRDELIRRYSLWGSVDASRMFAEHVEQNPLEATRQTGVLARWGWQSVMCIGI